MSQKKVRKFFRTILFGEFTKKASLIHKNIQTPMLTSLEYNLGTTVNNTGDFFKKITFWGLAVSNIKHKQGKSTTLRSTLMSLWNLIAAYTIVF